MIYIFIPLILRAFTIVALWMDLEGNNGNCYTAKTKKLLKMNIIYLGWDRNNPLYL